MLFYAGHTRRIGNVDEGSTVTDFLPAERSRGITIQSAAITFDWPPNDLLGDGATPSRKPHHVNLIDTPGHADFTFEVRRSIRVLDGAVCILDGVAGVEAQTEQVWNQAGEWKIPRIIYVNKLDRDGAAFGRSVREIGLRLDVWPALCQIPWFEGGRGSFTGVADVVALEALKYDLGSDGTAFKRFSLSHLSTIEPNLAEELRRARIALVELLSEHDDVLVEAFFAANEDHLAVSSTDILQSLRRCLLRETPVIVPVFAGASFRNIGVQPLLDAVNDLFPAPEERSDPEISMGPTKGTLSALVAGKLNIRSAIKDFRKKVASGSEIGKHLQGCALAFKVVNDPKKGVLVYIRVYSGTIRRNDVLYNTNVQEWERAMTLLRMYGSDSEPVESVQAGQIAVIAGSKFHRTGDTLICYAEQHRKVPPEPVNELQLRPIHVPPPVFFAAIEPNSLKDERDLHAKLQLLLREDPSLSVKQDEDTGQTLLSGMGELHLEIARDRLDGPITIGYREALTGPSKAVQKIFESDKLGSKGKAGCTAQIEPIDESQISSERSQNSVSFHQDGNEIVVEAPSLNSKGKATTTDGVGLAQDLFQKQIKAGAQVLTLREIQTAFSNGASAALDHECGVVCCGSLATIAALKDSAARSKVVLLEPVMNVDISVDDASLGKIVQDISSSRGGHIVSLGDNEAEKADNDSAKLIDVERIYAPKDPFESSGSGPALGDHQVTNIQRTVTAKVPLKEMVGYLKHLRSMTGGRGTFVMTVDRFERVTGVREKMLMQELRGGATKQ
ncbi:Ribosome-releasing factor 2, mitochondrial [Cyphellophora attinorum]|uniref:Ribosome-releasing factor 2, mitochondrial n=1 Tax=Cyphellophora attinorum TaxID=1664694 RepID=A0A0N1H128_9EURO|nr:Ribosome-releasing factor 2, mitochondrial [Phialophora attinorum]KPI37670.1 Ribosome-releasing factor 2, mitochondrial [Phialophora attinorum]